MRVFMKGATPDYRCLPDLKRATTLRWTETVWIVVGQASQSSQAESLQTDNVGALTVPGVKSIGNLYGCGQRGVILPQVKSRGEGFVCERQQKKCGPTCH
ncbi:hypothetical protein PAMP_001624 [Pampus punctatissimus]